MSEPSDAPRRDGLAAASDASGDPSDDLNDPFNPEGLTWRRVSPKLAVLQLTTHGLAVAALLLPAVALPLVVGIAWLWAVPAVVAIVGAVVLALIPRRVRAWGYAEEADDLVITRGIMFKTLVVVPYGRMQYVDVQAGPLERALGLATVQLHTASPGTDAGIPGLVATEAGRLRERLASRGESRLAGL